MNKSLDTGTRAITLKDKLISYSVKKRRGRKNIGLSIDSNGLTVSTPLRVSKAELEDVLRQHTEWVIKKLEYWQAKPVHRQQWQHGATLQFKGEALYLQIEKSNQPALIEKKGGRLHIYLKEPENQSVLEFQVVKWLKQQAHTLLQERISIYATKLGVPMPTLRLSNARSYWGLCDGKNNILLNWRLIQMRQDLADYIVAHELSHLIQPNHSPAFWETVARIFPHYKQAKREVLRLTELYMAI